MLENGPISNSVGVSLVMRQLFDYMAANTPEYLKS
jgi:hypothetical protein